MKRSLLILAVDHDIHADAVHDLVQQQGYQSYRLDPEVPWTPSEEFDPDAEWAPFGSMAWSLSRDSHFSSLQWRDQNIDLTKVGAVFCRNFQFAKVHDDEPVEKHLKYAEMRAGLYGLFSTLSHCFWMNDPALEENLDNKMVQSVDALHAGLKIPKTLVTNDESRARKFIESCDGRAIIKQLSAIGLIDENSGQAEALGFFTSSVTKEAMEHLDEVKHAPCLFQEDILKKADVRATVVGDRIFAHAIDSQSREASKTDFRREIDLPISNFEFPDETGYKLIKLLKQWGIIFSACDFVLTPNNELIFLEANVVGNWLWLENGNCHPILDEVVRLLSCKLR